MKKYVGIASIPHREKGLIESIHLLSPQVDHIYVWLNGYDTKPDVDVDNVTFHLSDENIGDNGKFEILKFITDDDFYLFTCDDDIMYYDGYIQNHIDNYEQGTIQSYHGSIYDIPVRHYIGSRNTSFQYNSEVVEKKRITLGGTGVMMMDSSIAKQLPLDNFVYPNMTDVWVSCISKTNDIPIYITPHKGNWIIPNPKIDQDKSLWKENGNKGHQLEIKVLNHYLT